MMKPDNSVPPYRILVIDDNISIHEDFRKILMKSNSSGDELQAVESALFGSGARSPAPATFEIDCASQGRDGLEMVRQAQSEGRPYALAFVDGRIPPGWDGIETIGRLWQDSPELQVVLCTAYADYSWQDIRRLLGESDSLLILKKPFDNVEVLQLAHALTRKWELNRAVQSQIENLDDLVRQRTEEKERTRVLLEAALEHSPSGIIISNADGSKIRWANPAAQNICGSTPLVTAGTGTNDIFVNFDAYRSDGMPYPEGELPLLRAVARGEILHDEEVLLLDAQGQERWISSNAAPIREADGAIAAGIVIFEDITERKHSERERERLQAQLGQAQKMKSVGLLAGGIAHDYNNVMGVILGHAELGMLTVNPKEPIYDTLKEIQKAARRSADLTQQLLAFARRQPVAPKVLDLNKEVADALTMLHRMIGEDIELIWKPDSELWPVRIDPSQTDQILLNLCVNAREAITGVGKITIATKNAVLNDADVALHSDSRCGEYAVLSVSDNGRGIDKEVLDRIFEPFFSTKKMGKSSGLGLATVYGIVRQNEGFIHVDSESGKGSTFSIYLPRFVGAVATPIVENTEVKNSDRGEKVLIVEDEEGILGISKAMLERLGYAVLTASTPEDALREAEANAGDINLLITDVIMPRMNGRELAQNLLSLDPNLKCLFISGYTADIIAQRGVLNEGVHFLQKPFSMKNLAAKIREVLCDEDGK